MSRMFLVFAFASFCLSNARAAESMYGLFMVVKGDVQITDSKEKTSPAKVGSRILPGETVTSGADARAKIVMSDRNVINVSPASKLKIERYENDAKTGVKNVEMNLIEGKVRNNVEQKYDDEKSKFQIKTPTAVAGVRGTQFVMGFNKVTRATSIMTFKGTVAVRPMLTSGGYGSAVLVGKGQSSNVSATGQTETPKTVPKEELKQADKETTASTNQPGSTTASNNVPSGRGPANEGSEMAPPPPPPPPPEQKRIDSTTNYKPPTYVPPTYIAPKAQKAKVTITPTH